MITVSNSNEIKINNNPSYTFSNSSGVFIMGSDPEGLTLEISDAWHPACQACGDSVRVPNDLGGGKKKAGDAVVVNGVHYCPRCAIKHILMEHDSYFADPDITCD